MGTSLSGLTPATTFDGLLKTSDNDAITTTLKTIGSGDGTDSCLQLSNSALKVNSGQVTIVGAGNTGATSSLLIQNSSASDLLRVNDSGEIRMQSLDFLGNKITSLARISTSGLAINNAGTNPDANTQLHIKGSGATSATTSLLVQNSSGDNIVSVTDDGAMTLKASGASNTLILDTIGGVSGFQMNSNDGQQRFRIQATSSATRFTPNNTNDAFTFVGNAIYTDGAFDTPTARLHVKGAGNTSATTSLLVQNSAGTDLLKVSDDGRVLVDEYIYPADGTTNSRFRVSNSSGTYMYYSTGNLRVNPSLVYTSTTYGTVFSVSSTTGDFNLNGATGAKMAIKGNGATSATTALLVENSSGTELLKVVDDGNVSIGSFKQLSAGSTNFGIILEGTTSMQFKSWNKDFRFFTQNGVVAEIKNDGSTIVGGSTPDASAKLQVDSTTQGFLPPRMTGEQIDAIESPASGLIIYNTTSNKAVCYNGTSWNDMF